MATVSVVIPVHNGAAFLDAALDHLSKSSLLPLECIVVDDGSTDNSAAIARRWGAQVLSTEVRRGPAHARNLGAAAARGDILFFVDADVCVHHDTVARIVEDFAQDPVPDAVIGSYDKTPASEDFVSSYRNLMHAFFHHQGRREASSFWSGCGAVNRQLFLNHHGFDEVYDRPAIEDIEFGVRLIRAGKSIVLDRKVQVTHLKRWSLWTVLKTDVFLRGIPWTELILRHGVMPDDLNIKVNQRVSVALVFLAVVLAAAAAIVHRGHFLAPLFSFFLLLLGRYWAHAVSRPPAFRVHASITALFAVTAWLGYAAGMPWLVPAVLFGYVFLFLRLRFAYQDLATHRFTGWIYGLYFLLATVFILLHFTANYLIAAFLIVLTVVVLMNYSFYIFLAERWGHLYVLAVLPFHLLYHFYNGISFLAGASRYAWRSLRR